MIRRKTKKVVNNNRFYFFIYDLLCTAWRFLGSLVVLDIKRYVKNINTNTGSNRHGVCSSNHRIYFPPEHSWLFAGAGVFVGIITTSLLDTVKATAPKLSQKIINSVYNKAERIIGSKTETNRKD